MTDMDVSLRLRLVNQLSRPAEEAEKDLNELQKAAEKLGRTKAGGALAQDLHKVGAEADAAKAKISTISKEADQTRRAIGRIGDGFADVGGKADKAGRDVAQISDRADNARLAISRIGEGFGNLKADAIRAGDALEGIQREARVTREAIGRIGDGSFDGLKADAASAEAAIKQIGNAADQAQEKIRRMGATPAGNPAGSPGNARHNPAGPIRPGSSVATGTEAFLDRMGVDAYIPLGAGAAYMAGGTIAGGAVIAGAAVNAAAGDEFRSDQLAVTGEYDEDTQRRYDAILARAGARHGVGTAKAQETYGALIAGGLNHADAVAMTDTNIKVAKATTADPTDIANTTVALRNNMGITAGDLGKAYDTIALGGKEGQFELPDVARHGPSIFAAMSTQGSKGLGGVRLATAMAQSIRKTTGSGDQAKTALEAMLTDMVSPDVVERAKEYGVDPFKVKDKAVAQGKDPVLAVIEAYKKAVGGDERKMRDLFRNSTAFQGYAAVFGDLDNISGMMGRMENADGTIDRDYERATDNFSSQRDKLTSTLGRNIKNGASPALGPLKTGARVLADTLEDVGGRNEVETIRAQPAGRAAEALLKWLSGGSRLTTTEEAYRQRADSYSQPSTLREALAINRSGTASYADRVRASKEPMPWDDNYVKPDAQLPDSALGRSSGAIPVPIPRPAQISTEAGASMDALRAAISSGGEAAVTESQSIADRIRAIFGFTVSPTIAPTYIQPGSAPSGGSAPAAGEKHSSLTQASTVKVAQSFYGGGNPRLAASRAQREQNRAVRQAMARSLSDTGPKLA